LLFSGSSKLWALENESFSLADSGIEHTVPEQLHLNAGRYRTIFDLTLTNVQAILNPLGTGFLVFEIDWLPSNPEGILNVVTSIDDLQMCLFSFGFKNRAREIVAGFTFSNSAHGMDDSEDNNRPSDENEESNELETNSPKKQRRLATKKRKKAKKLRAKHLQSLGRMADAVYREAPITLEDLGNWLIQLPDESATNPPVRVNHAQCRHHSMIVLNSAPTPQTLSEHLLHLRFGLNQLTQLPSESKEFIQNEDFVRGDNCYIGLSREGTVCLSWPMKEGEDIQKWPDLFQGIYLILALAAYAESEALVRLGMLAAEKAVTLLQTTHTFEEMENCRAQLRELASVMVRYMLSLCSCDCGGSTDYAQFFFSMSQVLGIPSIKQELREQIDDVLEVLQSQYMEELKKIKQQEVMNRMEKLLFKKRVKQRKENRRRWYRVIISAIIAASMPALILVSLFCMNVSSFPEYGWWNVTGFLLALSGVQIILMIILSYLFFLKRNKGK